VDRSASQPSAGELAVVLLAASLDQAVRSIGWVASVVLYAFMASTAVIVFWLFALAG
jgi:hypothetical protein